MMHHLDPADATTVDKMPGSLMAQNSSGAQRILETYGMMNVELQDASGNKLQIVNPTSIEMPISASQLATAPTTIPLWYFDETLGYWKEEGSATKVGTKYIGAVNHFSWWNCDAPFPTVSLGVTVLDSNQIPLANVRVELVRNTPIGSSIAPGYTNAAGEVSGWVPANQTLTMNIYSTNPACPNQIIYTQQIGPFSSNTVLETIIVPASALNTTVIQGTLTNCDTAPVTNGYVWLQSAGQFLYSQVTDGSFSFTVLSCSVAATSFNLQGIDFDSSKSTSLQIGTLNNQTIALGTLQACSDENNAVGQLYDIDQNFYTTVTIGQQIWTQQNLNVSRYTDGTPIPQVTNATQWSSLTTGAWCYYSNSAANGTIYGKLYNWYAIAGIHDNDPNTPNKALVPAGWHVSTGDELIVLVTFLGAGIDCGGKMKATGTTLWQDPNTAATNVSGFTGLPGGYCGTYGGFSNIHKTGGWWTSSEVDTTNARNFYLTYNKGGIDNPYNNKSLGFSVRCVKD
ncbi:MAG: hypothetical protein IPP30_06350 [Flavobacterium sp.]|nr:hypothetical protein [Flavobacterium sp.]